VEINLINQKKKGAKLINEKYNQEFKRLLEAAKKKNNKLYEDEISLCFIKYEATANAATAATYFI